jgi:DEAD/DEAH box helicase domain-containing protein
MAAVPSLFAVVEDVLNARQVEHKDQVAFEQGFPEREPVSVPWSATTLPDAIKDGLSPRFPGLFTHQAQAIQHIAGGENVVVTTRTSSGKSLIYTIPIARALLESDQATAILCYPQKALANDQLGAFQSLIPSILSAAGKRLGPHTIARYDGQTKDDEKPSIRAAARVILTNPEMLHLAVLGWHERHWQRFLTNLRYIILDEAHDYRGTFGSNIAMLMRRLLLVAGRYGASPQFIATSATIADPAGHMQRLTGKTFTVIPPDQDGSRQGPKRLWIVQPASHPFDLARGLMKELVARGLTVLTFCQSRQSAERLTYDMGKVDDAVKPVVVYRAGLSTEERVRIEQGLKSGTIGGVFSTSALELGIDIGALDVCICVGFPNTMMSLWQRAGRVGRAGKPGAVILIPDERPIDAYYTAHPGKLLARDMEPLAINLQSRTLATWHYSCALSEAGRNIELLEPSALGAPMETIAAEHRAGQDHPSYHSEGVHREYNMRAGGDASYELALHDTQLGEISRTQILRETPPNAIYLHGGRKYRVMSVDEMRKLVRLKPEHSANRTQSFVQTNVRLQQCWRAGHNRLMKIQEGRLLVTQSLKMLTEKRPDGNVVAQFAGNQGLKANILPTTGAVLTILKPSALLHRAGEARTAFNGLAPLMTGLLPTVLGPCDLGDFAIHPQWGEDEAKLYIYDVAYDGIDLTMHAFGRLDDLLQATLTRATECDCTDDAGCFRCVRNPFDDVPTDRRLTREMLKLLASSISSHPIEVTVEVAAPDRMAPVTAKVVCRVCESSNEMGQKFCGNCGTRLEGA